MRYVIGVDVGTGSARAGIFDETGKMHASESKAIRIHHPEPEWAEQSSDDIWTAICLSTRACLAKTNISAQDISGISYSATCSLVLLDNSDAPLVLSDEPGNWNIIVWMDHRAIVEADEITRSGSSVLNNVGGTMSPEMELPKLMWIKRNRPDIWSELGFAGDLADYLTYRSSGSTERSVCTLGCKWTYNPDSASWSKKLLTQIGLEDLLEKGQLPEQAVAVGTGLGALTPKAADDLGLTTNCQVATGLIDAHAGALGTIGLFSDDRIDSRLALIAGTSNCHIALSPVRTEVPGVWGPYGGAVVNNMWCIEGGQSATGALLDHIVELFAADKFDENPHAVLATSIKSLADENPKFAEGVEVLPDFIGNRTPFADPEMRGAILGLTIEDPWASFQKVYWATAASIAYGTRMIIDQLNACGYAIDTIHLSGGHKKSPLFVDLYADATGCKIILSEAEEPVLLGAAIAALQQFEIELSISAATAKMTFEHHIHSPRSYFKDYHDSRYFSFLEHYRKGGKSLMEPELEAKFVES